MLVDNGIGMVMVWYLVIGTVLVVGNVMVIGTIMVWYLVIGIGMVIGLVLVLVWYLVLDMHWDWSYKRRHALPGLPNRFLRERCCTPKAK